MSIDIKPGSASNYIRINSPDTIEVAILSTQHLNAVEAVDNTSLTFGRTGDEHSLAFCNASPEDVNGDGLNDLICHFYGQVASFQEGDTEGVLKAQTIDGTPIEGRDTVTLSATLLDTSPPIITPIVTGSLGNNNWYTSDVTVEWSVTDPESAITSTSGCGTSTVTADIARTTFTCSATSTGGTTFKSITIKRDATPPNISGSRDLAPNTNGWNNTNVTVTYVASDALSGLDLGASDLSDDVLSSEGANQSASSTAVDLAGNTAIATVSDINIDKTLPTIAPPADQTVSGTSPTGTQVTFTVTANDSLAGLDTLVSTPPSGSVFPTGSTIVTHAATDPAGNTATATHTITVLGDRGLLVQARNALVPYTDESRRFGKAISNIEESLDPSFWVDDLHLDPQLGHRVFSENRHAVKELMHLLKGDDGDSQISSAALAAAQAAIDDVVSADRLLASIILLETDGVVAVDPSRQDKVDAKLAKAWAELVEGDANRDAGKPDEAIEHYGEAWEYANDAAQEAQKEQHGSHDDDDD